MANILICGHRAYAAHGLKEVLTECGHNVFEFSRGDNYDTDYVISTRELIRIFKETGIDLKELEDEDFDNPLGQYSGAGIIFGRTGGVIEAATRSTIEMITGEKIPQIEFQELRGWEGFRIAELKIGHIELRIGIAHGLEEAAKMLEKDGISAEVINIHTIKPIDEELVVASATKTKKVVTVEEHSVIGGLGSAVAEVLCEKAPTKMIRIGVNDRFGESGPAVELIHKYELDAEGIYKKVKAFAK